MGDIYIPPEFEWVAYLAAGKWPPGSETDMWSLEDIWGAAGEDLDALIPDLNSVRAETLSVLVGQTAQAAGRSDSSVCSSVGAMMPPPRSVGLCFADNLNYANLTHNIIY